jgi:hypothetical protein
VIAGLSVTRLMLLLAAGILIFVVTYFILPQKRIAYWASLKNFQLAEKKRQSKCQGMHVSKGVKLALSIQRSYLCLKNTENQIKFAKKVKLNKN